MQSKMKFFSILGFSFALVSLLNLNTLAENRKKEVATLGGGCFWAMDSMFQELKGVTDVKPGYAGGFVKNPTYESVCNGDTGHAEAIQVTFDPNVISYSKILDVFWKVHDPTTLNRQGHDEGTQYRSAIFYHDKNQRDIAQKSKMNIAKSGIWGKDPIVTEVTVYTNFYEAEGYHKNYFANHPNEGYTKSVVKPKVDKFKKEFVALLK